MKEAKIHNGRDEINRHKLSDVVPLKVPYNIQLEPTDICNFKCEYCAHSVEGVGNNIMSWNNFMLVLNNLMEMSDDYKIVNLIGHGEPLIHPQISDMVYEINKCNITKRIEITTNGSLLTPKISDKLINAGLTRIIISLQGLNSEMYRKICKYNIDYDEFYNNIKYFYENKGKCTLHIKIADTALKDNEKDKFFDMFGNICDDLYIEHIFPLYNIDYTNKIRNDNHDNRYGYRLKEALICSQPFYQMYIKANGDVAPCTMHPAALILGNIKNEKLKDIWYGTKLKQFQILQCEKKRTDNTVCKNCITPQQGAHPLDNMDEYAEFVKQKILNF